MKQVLAMATTLLKHDEILFETMPLHIPVTLTCTIPGDEI